MRALFLSLCLFVSMWVQADEKSFYERFFCEQKRALAEVELTTPCRAEFWVAPDGNDANLGTEEEPFRTLVRARDAVRGHAPAIVYLKEGTYRLEAPLELNGMDSGKEGGDIVYSAAPGAHPVISGAIRVTGWALHDPLLGIYRAQVGGYTSRQLYVNGVRARRARTTENPAGFLPQWVSGGIKFTPTPLNPEQWRDPGLWQRKQEIEAVIVTQWKMMRVPLQEISSVDGLITLQEPAWNNANVYRDKDTHLPGEWSFWRVTYFENAYEFLSAPGDWYLDHEEGWLYYIPRAGEDLVVADVELPILEALIVGEGPIHNIRFEGLTFSYATWMGPSGSDGYVSDQSGQLLLGSDHGPNIIGHDQHVEPTPAHVTFSFASNITFYGNIFEHLGAVGLHFGTGSVSNTIESNLFEDISASAITLGAVRESDSHPEEASYILRSNLVTNNLIRSVAKEYVDAAAIFVGFTNQTTLSHNTIYDVPWAGIAVGWGWGLLDVGSFPGLPNASSGEWGVITSPTPNGNSSILCNRFDSFLGTLWDGGAIYTTGQQGPSLEEGLLIEGNVASSKRPAAGSNIFYTDGGSRYIRLQSNASYDNPIGETYYGPYPQIGDPYFFFYPPYYFQNGIHYGSDSGGCVTYGDISFTDNYWLEAPIPDEIVAYNALYHAFLGFYPYSSEGFFDPCPFSQGGVSYPVNLSYLNNHLISSKADIPPALLSEAGVQSRPSQIPASRWILPPRPSLQGLRGGGPCGWRAWCG